MKYLCIFSFAFFVMACQSSATKQEATTATATPIVAQQDSASAKVNDGKCQRQGKLIEKFEQNNALFERLSNEKEESEWLKVTTKDGKCFIIDSIGKENHHNVEFEDWDKDGMKDRIDAWKWDYEVALFDKTSNTFSRHIAGRFNGDQWDFDKSRNVKFQFLENKMGGVYELYKLVGANKTVLSNIVITNDQEGNGNDKMEIQKNIVIVGDAAKYDVVPMDSKLLADTKAVADEEYEAHQAKVKKAVEAYWRKNISVFMK